MAQHAVSPSTATDMTLGITNTHTGLTPLYNARQQRNNTMYRDKTHTKHHTTPITTTQRGTTKHHNEHATTKKRENRDKPRHTTSPSGATWHHNEAT